MVHDSSSCVLLCTAWNVSATQNGSFGLCPTYGECCVAFAGCTLSDGFGKCLFGCAAHSFDARLHLGWPAAVRFEPLQLGDSS